MDSREIKERCVEIEEMRKQQMKLAVVTSQDQMSYFLVIWLGEIALQLAKMNEGEGRLKIRRT